MSIRIDTERLYIREILPEDEAAMFEMDNDPEVHRFLGNNPLKTIEESRAMIAFIRQQYVDAGIGRWAVIEKSSGEFIGWTGFKLMRESVNGHTDFIDFGYRHLRRFWGKGLASEAARAALNYGVQTLDIQDVYAMTDIDNGASRHILESLGFKLVEIFPYDGSPGWRAAGLPTTWFKLQRDERVNGEW